MKEYADITLKQIVYDVGECPEDRTAARWELERRAIASSREEPSEDKPGWHSPGTLEALKAQLMVSNARVMRCHAEIVSGAYKFRALQQMDSSQEEGWRDLTDDEKLKSVMGEMRRHVKIMASTEEAILEFSTATEENVPEGLRG